MPDLMTEGLNERWEFEAAVCGANSKSKYKEDCYYYSEIADMGAHIPHCGKEMKLDNFNCLNCNSFHSKYDVVPVVHAQWLFKAIYRDCEGTLHSMFKTSCCCYDSEDKYNYCPNCGAKMDGEKIYGQQ